VIDGVVDPPAGRDRPDRHGRAVGPLVGGAVAAGLACLVGVPVLVEPVGVQPGVDLDTGVPMRSPESYPRSDTQASLTYPRRPSAV